MPATLRTLRTWIASASILILIAAGSAMAAESGVFTGSVRDTAGKPVAGAIVTFSNRSFARGTTVFSDSQGRFRLPPLEAGIYDLRVRRIGYKDFTQSEIALGDGTTKIDPKLEVETEPHELAWQLPASRWMPLVLAKLSSDQKREEFTRQCGYCHQQGSWGTRVQRSREDWEHIFDRMARYGGMISPELRAELPDAYNRAYDDDNYLKALTQPFTPPAPPEGPAATAVITEWEVGTPTSMLHDIAVYPDGSIYSVDTGGDSLYRLDPRTNQRREFRIPIGDSPVGGVFASTGTLQSPGSTAHVAPHSLQVAPDGTIWVTLCLGNKVGYFDPKTESWHIFKQKDGLYPHTIRFDHKGRVWYTLAVSNGVAMIDPATGAQRTFHLPARTYAEAIGSRAMPYLLRAANYLPGNALGSGEGANLPVPYGIDVAPDGGIWFSQLNARRIGHIDPDSGKITMIDTPFPGPRRLRFDSTGNLWIPSFSGDALARFNPATGEFKQYKMPTEGIETPYALNVDRRTDTVWICGTASDTLMSFDPRSEKFTVYTLPTRVTYTREIDFDKDGAIWTSNSNFPAWQIEAPNPRVIRIQPGAAPHAQ
jgi:virginiamycin B lyase